MPTKIINSENKKLNFLIRFLKFAVSDNALFTNVETFLSIKSK